MNDWRKSSHSFSNGNCVEVGQGTAAVGVRDSQDRDGPALTFTGETWAAFLGRVRAG